MEKFVEEIIRKIDLGLVFDSHYIIDTLIKDYSNEYLTFVAKVCVSEKTTEYVHSRIAKIIKTFKNNLVEKLDYESYSYNIRGKASRCALWKRI